MAILKNPKLRFAAAGCFAVPAVLQLVYLMQYSFSFWPFAAMVGYALAAVGLCKPMRIVSVVGCGIVAVTSVNTMIALMGFSLGANMLASSLITAILWSLIGGGLLMPRWAKLLCSIACGMGVVLIVLDISTGLSLQTTLRYLSITAGAFLCGYYLYNDTVDKGGSESRAEKLEKLQAQLENGEITQREYDAQEKRLLGL